MVLFVTPNGRFDQELSSSWSQKCYDEVARALKRWCGQTPGFSRKIYSYTGWGWNKYGYGSIPMKIPFLGEWPSIYQLFWCELQGDRVLTHPHVATGWWWLEPWNFEWLSIQLGMSSSQLTKSYFSEGLKPPARKYGNVYRRVNLEYNWIYWNHCWRCRNILQSWVYFLPVIYCWGFNQPWFRSKLCG